MNKAEKIAKIKKVLALASNNSSKGESDTAFKMAEQLMNNFGITHKDIQESDIQEQLGELEENKYEAKIYNWQAFLMKACCEAFDCCMLVQTVNRRKTYLLYGREGNIITVKTFFEWIKEKTETEAKEKFPGRQIKARNDYSMGVAMGLLNKVSELKKKRSQEGWGLVLVNESFNFMKKMHPSIKKSNVRARSSKEYDAGVSVGNNINLNKQVHDKNMKYIGG